MGNSIALRAFILAFSAASVVGCGTAFTKFYGEKYRSIQATEEMPVVKTEVDSSETSNSEVNDVSVTSADVVTQRTSEAEGVVVKDEPFEMPKEDLKKKFPVGTVFVSSLLFTGNMKQDLDGQTFASGLAGADYRCQKLAMDAGMDAGTMKALLSDTNVEAKDRIKFDGPVKDSKGNLLSPSLNQFWSGGDLMRSIDFDERGQEVTGYRIWSGTGIDGVRKINGTAGFCQDWSADNGDRYSATGKRGSKGILWLSSGFAFCGTAMHLYCIAVE